MIDYAVIYLNGRLVEEVDAVREHTHMHSIIKYRHPPCTHSHTRIPSATSAAGKTSTMAAMIRRVSFSQRNGV